MDRAGRANATWDMVVDQIGDVEFVNALRALTSSDIKEYYLKQIMLDYEIENEHDMYWDWNGFTATLERYGGAK